MKVKKGPKRGFVIQGVDAALRRAAMTARELAEKNQTPFFVLRDGKIVDLAKGATRESWTSQRLSKAPPISE